MGAHTVRSGCRKYVRVRFSRDILYAPRAVGTRRPDIEGESSFVHHYVRAVYLDFEGPSGIREAPGLLSAHGRIKGKTDLHIVQLQPQFSALLVTDLEQVFYLEVGMAVGIYDSKIARLIDWQP